MTINPDICELPRSMFSSVSLIIKGRILARTEHGAYRRLVVLGWLMRLNQLFSFRGEDKVTLG